MTDSKIELGLQLCGKLGMSEDLDAELTEIINDYEGTQLHKRVCRVLMNTAMRNRANFEDLEMLGKIIKEEISWQK